MASYKTHQKNNFKYRENLLSKPTSCELVVKDYLDSIGCKYIFQKGFLKPFHRIVDFYIPKQKKIIEVDGGYHKNTLANDLLKDTAFRQKRKMKILRITNQQVIDGSFELEIELFISCG